MYYDIVNRIIVLDEHKEISKMQGGISGFNSLPIPKSLIRWQESVEEAWHSEN
jgi:hypothetical protein